MATKRQRFSRSSIYWYSNLYASNVIDQKFNLGSWCLQISIFVEVPRRISYTISGFEGNFPNHIINYNKSLTHIYQDFRPCEVYTIEFLIDNTTMGFLMSDSEKNLVLYMYQPEARESCGGTL